MRLIIALVAASVLAVPVALAKGPFPATIPLPPGWQPEGIAIGNGKTLYAGSRATGAVYKADLRTGKGAVLVQPVAGRAATGLKFNRGRLFVSGAATGKAFIYDATTGALIREYQLAAAPTFINDVAVTKDAAYFTDSQKAVIFKLPLGDGGTLPAAAQTLTLSGDFQLVAGFNLNGIVASPDGKTLYVVQNQNNRIAVVRLAPDLRSGTVTDRVITSPSFDIPTTAASFGSRLYAVNARFTTPPTQTTTYSVVQVNR